MLIYFVKINPHQMRIDATVGVEEWRTTTDKQMVQHFVDEARLAGREAHVFSVEATHYLEWPE